MKIDAKHVTVLLAEDDDEDFQLTRDAFQACHLLNDLRRVANGEELMDYLRHRRAFRDLKESPAPVLILLDLNMPRKDGRECLREIKEDPNLKTIPVVVLTTSRTEEDIVRSYQLGVNSFIRKPVTFAGLVQAVQTLGQYRFEIVDVPAQAQASGV